MKTALTKTEFEALSSRLLSSLPDLDDSASLLLAARRLLDAELAILLRRDDSVSSGRKVVMVSPVDHDAWVEGNLRYLRGWCLASGPSPPARGYTNEGKLQAGDRTFSDALIAFAFRPERDPNGFELLVFQGEGGARWYSSYHCTVGAALLSQFLLLKTVREVKRERTRSKRYARALSQELASETWSNLVRQLREQGASQEPDFIGSIAIQWSAFRCRSSKPSKLEEAHEWMRRATLVGLDFYLAATKDLIENKDISTETLEGLRQMDWQDLEQYKAVLMVVEHAWRKTAAAASDGSACPESDAFMTGFSSLITLSLDLMVRELTNRQESERGLLLPQTELGRETLRIYFGHMVLATRSLKQRYLWLDGGEKHRMVPLHVRCEFIRNLSRYMLGVLEILERRAGIYVGDGLVSAMESLDSLLYLVDRFAHVELGVEESLHVRYHLARGFASEVQHHLEGSFYRDHLVHVIDVYLLGHILLNTRIRWVDGKTSKLIEHLPNLEVKNDAPTQVSEWERQWAVAALLHDIGYQLGRLRANDKSSQGFWQFFSVLGRGNASLSPGGERTRVLDFLKDICSNVKEEDERGWWLPVGHLDEVVLDHGVISSLRIAQLLMEADCAERGATPEKTGRKHLISGYAHALHAMAHHNLADHRVQLSKHPLSCLLRICDELQEWGRPRVDIEQAVKHLYLTLEGRRDSKLDTQESLERVEANLLFSRCQDRTVPGVEISVAGEVPQFFFTLYYRNAIDAHYDPTTTFLAKAYNLQHVDHGRQWPLKCRIQLVFPRPSEYRGLTEHDIYGLYAHRSRVLPEMWSFSKLDEAEPGLCRIEPEEDSSDDRVGIVISGGTSRRLGRQRTDPGNFRDDFIRFKKELLTGRALGDR